VKLEDAKTATDLFGPLPATPAAKRAAKRLYRILVQETHPDKGGSKELFQKLQGFYDTWAEGKPAATSSNKPAYRAGSWQMGDLLAKGSVANLYATEPKALVKLPRKASSNHFIQAEIDALTALATLPQQLYSSLLDQGKIGDRQYLVESSFFAEYFSLAQVHEQIPELDGRDYAWMHRRLLGAIAGAHQQGIVHGAVLPEHVLIHPASHDLRLVGWSFSGKPGTDIPARVQSRATMYPWGTRETTLTPEFDVYMAHSVMQHMLPKGRNTTEEMRQRHFAKGCMSNAPAGRPSAVEALRDYDSLLLRLYGKRKFIPFVFPQI
jgi:hypothetical protein